MLARMTIERIRHLPVIDDKELKGIVSIGDLVKHRLDEKELEASVLLDISQAGNFCSPSRARARVLFTKSRGQSR